ncbi:hypothetical protein R1sor_024455 [Riccia sorocarpa]|uniref:Uncharacterized protein n=1 Tax=Riccia sorocarpa TaxID=122646 RepID=A0ABD3GWM3_9MARC
MDPPVNDLESDVTHLLKQQCPAETLLSPVRRGRKTRVVSSSSRRIMLSTPLNLSKKSPVRICLQASPGSGARRLHESDSQPASQLLSTFQSSIAQGSASQVNGWSLRRQKGVARKGTVNSQLKRTAHLPAPAEHPSHEGGSQLAVSANEGSSDNDDVLPVAAPKPGRIPPPSIRHMRRWKSVAAAADSAPIRHCLDNSKLPVLEVAADGAGAPRPYVLRSLFRDSGGYSAGQPATGVKSSTDFLKIIGAVSDQTEVLLEGTILTSTFESESEEDWISEEDDHSVQAAANDPEGESDWEDYKAEILEEDLPRLGLMKTDEDFHSDPLEWQLADENWPSASTAYSHNSAFEGGEEEPIPSWFYDKDASKLLTLQPMDIFNPFEPDPFVIRTKLLR